MGVLLAKGHPDISEHSSALPKTPLGDVSQLWEAASTQLSAIGLLGSCLI